ncbi:unnamed protein product [Durusdinium trenchii]|uniref:Uncharacterized protein n=2 Tax=Durusdinium trenchii TaxID=1381693 RepID=A0ABP0R3Y0_9DINO
MISFYDWAPAQQTHQGNGHNPVVEDPVAQNDTELQKAICQKIQDAVDISDVFNKVAIHAGKASPKTLVYAVHRIARYCRLRRQDIGPTRRAARFLSLLENLQRNLATLDAQALTDLSWSLAVLNHREKKILAGLCHQLFARVDDFSPANLAISAWSFATLNYRDDLVMKRLNRQALGRLQDFEAQSLANLSWAEATMRFKDDVLMHHIAGEALRKMDRFSPQHVANTAWAYATLGRRANALFEALEGRALQLLNEDAPDFVPLDLALCAWSFAWLEHVGPHSELLHAIARAALRRLDEFSTQQLANMLWGLDHANYVNPSLFETVVRWCCSRPISFWQRAAGEEMVSVMTALRPYASGHPEWRQLEAFFTTETLRPLARFLCSSNTSEGYVQGLRQLRTYHGGALYTSWLLEEIGIVFLGDGNDTRVSQKVEDLLKFYLLPPEPRWLPDGYEDDDVQANRAEIPSLLELLDVKRRVQPSSHFIALHLSAELEVRTADGRELRRSIWRAVPTRPPRRSGLSFVRGEKFEDHGAPDDDEPGFGMKTATLRDYQRKHHAEVTALSQVVEMIEEMDGQDASSPLRIAESEQEGNVSGWVELFVPHYPCSSCIGALVQFAKRHPKISLRVGHDDWRHWLRRLDAQWDPQDLRHHMLSINARQLRELDQHIGEAIPASYRAALKGTLGSTGFRDELKPVRGEGYPKVDTTPAAPVRQTFY